MEFAMPRQCQGIWKRREMLREGDTRYSRQRTQANAKIFYTWGAFLRKTVQIRGHHLLPTRDKVFKHSTRYNRCFFFFFYL